MKLSKITNIDPVVTKKINIHISSLKLITSYSNEYKKCYGDLLELSKLFEHAVEELIKKDKPFMKRYIEGEFESEDVQS